MSTVSDKINEKKFQENNEFRRTAPDILDLEAAAKYLGLSPRVLSEAVQEQGVPCRLVGRTHIFSKEALNRWVGDVNEA